MIKTPRMFWSFAFVGFSISVIALEFISYMQGYSLPVKSVSFLVSILIAFLTAFIADGAFTGSGVSNKQLRSYLYLYALLLTLFIIAVMGEMSRYLSGVH